MKFFILADLQTDSQKHARLHIFLWWERRELAETLNVPQNNPERKNGEDLQGDCNPPHVTTVPLSALSLNTVVFCFLENYRVATVVLFRQIPELHVGNWRVGRLWRCAGYIEKNWYVIPAENEFLAV